MKAIFRDNTGLVVNVVAWNQLSTPPAGIEFEVVADDFNISPGWIWNGVGYINPSPFIPPVEKTVEVSAAQGMLALLDAGLLDTVTAAVENSNDPALKIWFNRAATWHRTNVQLTTLAAALNITDVQIDALFELAGSKK